MIPLDKIMDPFKRTPKAKIQEAELARQKAIDAIKKANQEALRELTKDVLNMGSVNERPL